MREQQQFRRVKGAGTLAGPQLAALEKLVQWREQRAREIDKPRGWVVEDRALLAIAKAMPSSEEALLALDVAPPKVMSRHARTFSRLLGEAAVLAEDECPESSPRPLAAPQRQQLKKLKSRVRARAEEIGVAPEVLLSATDLELLVREVSGEPISRPARWSGWRAGAVLDLLRGVAA